VNKTNSIIEVNGNRYDAVTGKLVSAGQKAKHTTASSGKKMIDGFVLGAHHTRATLKKPLNAASKAAAKRELKPADGLHRTPERPKTLIRKGLKKPANSPASSSQAHRRAISVNPIKEMRARTTDKHASVNRFGHFTGRSIGSGAAGSAKAPAAKVISAEARPLAAAPPSLITSASHKKLEKMLDEALLKANAHKHMMNQHSHKKGLALKVALMPKWLSFGAVGFIVAALAAFLIWQNLPAVAVHVAAAKAHVNASMPGYTPTGFDYVGPLRYSHGAVTMQFQDKTDPAQKFSLTQKASNWSSASLEANALPKESSVQTATVNGTTVYIYGDKNDATWVNHNVLYSLNNQAGLSSDQVLRIVEGL
jgi:hypothetical protein